MKENIDCVPNIRRSFLLARLSSFSNLFFE